MNRIFKYFFALVFTCTALLSFSQNEARRWYFGNYSGLDFTTAPPTVVTNSTMATWEGCSTISDASGNLLFYTNGVTVWNNAHVVMANGTGLTGDNSSSQSALIVKQPGNQDIYYIFTTAGGAKGFRYSVIDMSLAAGMGSVTTKNVLLAASSTERLCGTKHCNGSDVWIVSHENFTNVFRAYLVSSAGVSSTAVISPAGTNMNGVGCMKISPNGKKLGAALNRPYAFELYDFNAATGVISNPITLPVSSQAYGCEFSPDGTKFYGSLWDLAKVTYKLRQWDFCSQTGQAIALSERSFNATHTGQLQLGPDGKIYQARANYNIQKVSPELSIEVMTGEPMLGVIHNPNASANQVNFNNTGLSISPGESMFGLPNFVSGFYKTPVAQFTYSDNPAVNCLKINFTAPPLINNTCSATSYTITNVKWIFGDAASGTLNTSTLINPDHTFSSTGTYKVKLILYNSCGGVIDTLKQDVMPGSALINNPSSFSICTGQGLLLSAAGTSSNYSWSTGAITGNIFVTPTVNTTYSLSYTDQYGCHHQSVQTVTVHQLPSLSVISKDSVCTTIVVPIKASGALTYSWSTGSTNSTISVTPSVTTVYSVTGSTFYGCSATKVVTVVIKPAPLPVIMANTIVCMGAMATATVVDMGHATYSWNTGIQGTTFTVIPKEDQYVFSVTAKYNNGCKRFERVRYNLQRLPEITIAGNSTVCSGAAVTNTAKGAVTYSWSNGALTNTVVFTPTINSSYTVFGADMYGCASKKTVSISVRPGPVPKITASKSSVCAGDSLLLTASGGNQFQWENFPGSLQAQKSVVVKPAVSTLYSVKVTENNCSAIKTFSVNVKEKPFISAGRDTIFDPIDPMYIYAKGTGTISWVFGENILCKDCDSTQILPKNNGCYIAQAINDSGCIATDEICVDIGPEYAVYIPNSFTPNNDGLNDNFFVSGFGLNEVRITIYDRWGQKIFVSQNENEGWNGNVNNKQCQPGIYLYVVEFVLNDGRRRQKVGNVNLL